MLPFLKKNMGGSGVIIAKTRTPDATSSQPPAEEDAAKQCAQRLIDAVNANDADAVVAAARDLFMSFDSDEQPSDDADEQP